MGGYIGAFGLLVIMLFLMVRPFLAPAAAPAAVSAPDVPAPTPSPALRAAAVAAAAPAAGAVIDVSDASATARAAADESPAPADDVRSKVEAAIAARKAALRTVPCVSCGTALEPGDAFCRSCGGAQASESDEKSQEEASS
jgi:hypothetical protein